MQIGGCRTAARIGTAASEAGFPDHYRLTVPSSFNKLAARGCLKTAKERKNGHI